MFQFSGFPLYDYFFHHTMLWYCHSVFPHSDICVSLVICTSTQLFAACHVLLRLLMPWHSPYALISLTLSVWTNLFSYCCYLLISFLRLTGYSIFSSLSFMSLYYSVFKIHFPQCFIVVGLSGLEPPTSRLSGVRSNRLSYKPIFIGFSYGGGDEENRTPDPLLARQVLSQLSYTPIFP